MFKNELKHPTGSHDNINTGSVLLNNRNASK